MGLLQKFKAALKDDWCGHCACAMDLQQKQLYALPSMTVGHYQTIEDPNYYLQNLVKVNKKAEIPVGIYACGTYLYNCPQCGKTVAKLVVFLPVRDQEQVDGAYLFENQTLIDFLKK